MVGFTCKSKGEMPDAYNGRDNTQGKTRSFQSVALLNMKFQKAFPRREMGCEGIASKPGSLKKFRQVLAFSSHQGCWVQAFQLDSKSLTAKAYLTKTGSLFFGKGDDAKRPNWAIAKLMPIVGDSQGNGNAQGTIIFAALGYGV